MIVKNIYGKVNFGTYSKFEPTMVFYRVVAVHCGTRAPNTFRNVNSKRE